MYLITIMDYLDLQSQIMCKAWIYFAKRYNPQARITIFHDNQISDIKKFSKKYHDIFFHKILFPKNLNIFANGAIHQPVQNLRLSVWKEVEKMKLTKFIYVDADAFILDSLKGWWDIINQKPYIAIDERQDGSSMLFNAGVHSYSLHKFITLEKFIEQYHADGDTIKLQASEQGLVNSYFRRIGYNYTHPLIGHEYNSLAKYSHTQLINDENIIVYSGTYPLARKIFRKIIGTPPEWSEGWRWWNMPKKVKILHAFGGNGYKFWELPECRTLWNYAVEKTI